MLKKFRNLKQKKLMVEDYAHNFKILNRRLQTPQRPTKDQLRDYFYHRYKELRTILVGQDHLLGANDFNDLVGAAQQAKRRFGITKKKIKKKKFSNSDTDSNEESGSNADNEDSNESD